MDIWRRTANLRGGARRVIVMAAMSGIVAALTGVVGLAVFWILRRRGVRIAGSNRIRLAAGAAGVLLLATGSIATMTTAAASVPTCVIDTSAATTPITATPTAENTIEDVATAAPTGLAIIVAEASGAHLCLNPDTGVYVAARDQGFVATVGKGALIGSVFLAWNTPYDTSNPTLAAHEDRHKLQWTVATAAAGPLAYPIAYATVDFFFPGGRNIFERDAGLAGGDYDPNTPLAPVLGPAQILVLLVAGGMAAFLVMRRLRRGRLPLAARLRPWRR